MIKNMNSKMTTNSQLSTTEPKKQKQVEQEQNHRIGDHWKSYQWGGMGGEWGKSTGNKKHKWQVENRQGRLRIVLEMEKPKNLYVQPMDLS